MKHYTRVLLALFLCIHIHMQAQTITSKPAGGAWEDAATWVGNAVPGSANDVVIAGPVSITSFSTACKNITINAGAILQHGGGMGWVTPNVYGNVINNGTIRNNPVGNALNLVVYGDLTNNGAWDCAATYLPMTKNQHLLQAAGKYFNTQFFHRDANGSVFDSGKVVIASSNLTFNGPFDLGWANGVLDMAGYAVSFGSAASLIRGTLKNASQLTGTGGTYLDNLSIYGDLTLRGCVSFVSPNTTFYGNVTNADTLQNAGGLGWLTPRFKGNVTNNGVIRNNPGGSALWMEIYGDIVNNGRWENSRIYIPAYTRNQYIGQASGKLFAAEVYRGEAAGYVYDSSKAIIATSDITFTNNVDLRWLNGTIDMTGHTLTLGGNAVLRSGLIKNTPHVWMSGNAILLDISFAGDVVLHGNGWVGSATFTDNLTVVDSLQSFPGSQGTTYATVYKKLVNNGIIRNHPLGTGLVCRVYGEMMNLGTCINQEMALKTEGHDVSISGTYDNLVGLYQTGTPASGTIYVNGKLLNKGQIYFMGGSKLVVQSGCVLTNLGSLAGGVNVVNEGTFYASSVLQWWDAQLNPGLWNTVGFYNRNKADTLKATFYKNMFHPKMSSAMKQWWRVKSSGPVGSYAMTLTYDDKLLNGNKESTLEVFCSQDSGTTWKKISTPLNLIRDTVKNTLSVGNGDYPVIEQFGDFVIASGGAIAVPSISLAIGGRATVRVGPPNRYTVSYWNNNEFSAEKFFIKLTTNRGVHIKSIVSKNTATGKLEEIPIDSLTYNGVRDEAYVLVDPLASKEMRSFDVIVSAEPDPSVRVEKTAFEPITLTAIALWVGGAIIEDYISNTMVEGCYEMWRPVRSDQTLFDASKQVVKNSMVKAATVENGMKSVAKKGAEHLLAETGKKILWPAALASDLYDCMKNAVNGMKDYVNGNFDKQSKELIKVTSWDPNGKEGPSGFGTSGFIAATAPMLYTIYFENKKEATAPAWKIVVIDTLDTKVFDPASVQFGAMSHAVGVPVRANNILTWTFEGIELVPNAVPPQGEGWVQFTVKPKENLPTGTQLKNAAVITFDLNKPLATNTTLNTLDFDAPKTTVPTILKVPGKDQISLAWSIDDGKGAGVKHSMVFMASNDGPFTLVKTTDSTQAVIPVVKGVPYQFYVVSEDNVGNAEKTPVKIIAITTGIASNGMIPAAYALAQNYPNPFNPSTTISYELPRQTHVTIDITDILGKSVRTLVSAEQPAGSYAARWDGLTTRGARASSGVYFCRMRTDDYTSMKKMMLLK